VDLTFDVGHFVGETKPDPVSAEAHAPSGVGFARGFRHAAAVHPSQHAPATGGRFDVRLLEENADGARFRLELATADGRWSGAADVAAEDGRIELGSWLGDSEPPAWLLQYVRAALRAAWRQRASEGWPRRFTRWREERSRDSGSAPE
jgi:hypothetical protein